jgi:hypothetical protein
VREPTLAEIVFVAFLFFLVIAVVLTLGFVVWRAIWP